MLTTEQYDLFQQMGYLLVPDLFSIKQLTSALTAAEENAYGKSFSAFNAEMKADPDLEAAMSRPKGLHGFGGPRAEYHDIPSGVEAIDRVVEHEPLLDALEDLLNTSDMHYHHGFVYVRSGRIDRQTPTELGTGFHLDWSKPLLPPHPNWKRYGHVQAWVFLNDIDADCAPVLLIPGIHNRMSEVLCEIGHSGKGDYGFDDIRKVPHYEEPVTITGKAGAVLFYTSHTPHAAQPFADKDKQRAVLFFAVGRRDTSAWTMNERRDIHERQRLKPFLAKTTARVRSLFGWPKPGDEYYTPTTLELIQNAYPEMDVNAYR